MPDKLTKENLAAHNQSLGIDTDDNEASSTERSTSAPSTYNGSQPELLRNRAETLQDAVDDYKVDNNNLEVVKRLANKADTGIPLSNQEQNMLDSVKADMDLDNTISLSHNINTEINSNKERISELEEKINQKTAKADALSPSKEPEANPSNSATTEAVASELPKQTPTQYVHELESESPMDIATFDD